MNNASDFISLSNSQLDMAFDYVVNTNRSIFLTGKAGTGKTTFLTRLKSNNPKRMVVVAPTGVAAINAGGVTIHSLFQLPFSPFIPNQSKVEIRRFTRDKINLIKSIDLLVIDEISMVRCDVLDAIDSVLRQFRNRYKPFGGLQLLMIGDINQLAPVVKDDEWEILRNYYENVFFFSSSAYKQNVPLIIELKHIFRQSDQLFISLLNKVRNNLVDDETFEILNSRLNPQIYESSERDGYIALTTHNNTAKAINAKRLNELESLSYTFNAIVKGEFSEYSFPTDEHLELKNGAQVMFIKNDTAKEKRFFNGKIGKIININSEQITVSTDEHDSIEVGLETWDNIKYTLNADTKKLDEQEIGSFTQIPLKLAYAITIHKSQGLTFDKVIIDAQAAFSSGQVYVALSRCRTLEGIVLSTPIYSKSIKLDGEIDLFNRTIADQILSEKDLHSAKFQYQESLIYELLDYELIHRPMVYLHKLLLENSPPIDVKSKELVKEILINAENDIGKILNTFQKQIKEIISQTDLPETNTLLNERLNKAAEYFIPKIETLLVQPLQQIHILTENKTIQDSIHKAIDTAKKAIFIKMAGFKNGINPFIALKYVQAKVNAELDFEKGNSNTNNHRKRGESKSSPHPELYASLYSMRKTYAQQNDVEEYQIFAIKALVGIVNNLPTHFKALENIKGIGKVTSQRYGVEIIEVVKNYCEKYQITSPEFIDQEIKPKREIGQSNKISYELFKEGKTVKEIATERGFAESTINGHLASFVAKGLLQIESFLTKPQILELTEFYKQYPDISWTDAVTANDNKYSYQDIRFFISFLAYSNQEVPKTL